MSPLFIITSGLTGFIPVITTKLLGDKYALLSFASDLDQKSDLPEKAIFYSWNLLCDTAEEQKRRTAAGPPYGCVYTGKNYYTQKRDKSKEKTGFSPF